MAFPHNSGIPLGNPNGFSPLCPSMMPQTSNSENPNRISSYSPGLACPSELPWGPNPSRNLNPEGVAYPDDTAISSYRALRPGSVNSHTRIPLQKSPDSQCDAQIISEKIRRDRRELANTPLQGMKYLPSRTNEFETSRTAKSYRSRAGN